jgi:hypothetical protein
VTLALSEDATEYVIRPLGNPSHEDLDALVPDLRHKVPQGRARASFPALWHKEKLIGMAQARLVTPWPPEY